MSTVTSTLPYSTVGTRIRKSVEYVRHYYPDMRATLESGDLLLVVPASDFGYYIVRPDTQPEILVDKTYNLAVPFTTSVPAFLAQGGASQNNLLVTNFDVDRGEIAHYKISVFDHGINVQVQQPGGLSRFTDKSGTRRLNSANTSYYNFVGEWGAMTEYWTFQDNTPVTLTVSSASMDGATYWARVKVVGYKYQLIKVRPKNPRAEPRVVLTADVGQRQK
jgi:hypothetical protein